MSASITFVFVSGPEIEAYAIHGEDLATGIELPDNAGPVIVELTSDFGSFCSVVQVVEA